MIKPLLSAGQKTRAILCFAGLITLGWLYYSYMLQPSLKSLANLRQTLIDIENQPVVIPSEQQSAEEMKAKVKKLKSLKKELDSVFKKEKNIPPLTRTIRNLSQKNSVDLRDSVKVSTSQQGHFVKADCTLTAVGKYEDIKKFLSSLAAEGCLIKTADMAVNTETKDSKIMKLSVSMVYYRYNK